MSRYAKIFRRSKSCYVKHRRRWNWWKTSIKSKAMRLKWLSMTWIIKLRRWRWENDTYLVRRKLKIYFLFIWHFQHDIKGLEKALMESNRNNDTGFSDFLGAIDSKDIETHQKVIKNDDILNFLPFLMNFLYLDRRVWTCDEKLQWSKRATVPENWINGKRPLWNDPKI